MRIGWWLAALTLFMAAPAIAQLPEAEAPTEAPATAEQQIDATQDVGADERIAERIRGFYGALDDFAQVEVSVEQGVVTLDGVVPSDPDIEEAERLASRVDGVVTVQNNLERDLSLDEGLDAVGGLQERVGDFVKMLPLIAMALAIAVAIAALGWIIAGFSALWRKVTPNAFLAELVASAIRFVFAVGGIIIALDILGATALLGAVLGGAGVIGIALGFAMRDTVENYVASLMLSLRQPFRPNDHVLIDDKEGRVIRLTSRATVLMTLDGNHLRIPNGQVFKAVILNYTRNPQRRFEFDLGIDADDDALAGQATGRDALSSLPFVLDDPAPEVRIVEVGDSNVLLRFHGWVDQTEADWHKAKSRAIAACKTALEDAGFALPEPIYRLRFDSRTGPLPMAQVAEQPAAADAGKANKPAAKSLDATISEESDDVSPDDEIARMVDSERKAGGGQQDGDLLDPERPVE